MKIFYRIILSIILAMLLTIFIIILNNIVFNVYCTLIDYIGYNSITKFIRFFIHISDWIILVIMQIILGIFYMTKNK